MADEEFVIAYVDEDHPLECDAHFGFMGQEGVQVVGLRVMRRTLTGPQPTGFICLGCISRMWNTPPGVPIEPSSEEREEGTPILEQKEWQSTNDPIDLGDITPGTHIIVQGRTYEVTHARHKGFGYELRLLPTDDQT